MVLSTHRLPAPSKQGVGTRPAALRAEALCQLRWQQAVWERQLAAHHLGTPSLVPRAERAGLNHALELLREAGEEVPSWLYQHGSLVRTTDAMGRTQVSVSLARLVADITRVLEWFDPEPSAQAQGISSEHPRPDMVAGRRT
jgi:hypothetical protein